MLCVLQVRKLSTRVLEALLGMSDDAMTPRNTAPAATTASSAGYEISEAVPNGPLLVEFDRTDL
jgi:hypothetical protein